MARLRNTATGVVVNVADGKRLDGYEPVDAKSSSEPAKKAAPKKKSGGGS